MMASAMRRNPAMAPAVKVPDQQLLALYIHWPFCISKCPYCDFNSHVRDSIDEPVWRDALLADLARSRHREGAAAPAHLTAEVTGRRGGDTKLALRPAASEAAIAIA